MGNRCLGTCRRDLLDAEFGANQMRCPYCTGAVERDDYEPPSFQSIVDKAPLEVLYMAKVDHEKKRG